MIKLIESHFDEESGISCVTLDTDLGKFYGYAFLNREEDAEIASAYFGLEALYSFRVDLKRNPQYNSESFEAQLLDRRINQKENQKRIYDVMIKNLKNAIKTRPEQRIENIKLVNQILEKNKENKDKE